VFFNGSNGQVNYLQSAHKVIPFNNITQHIEWPSGAIVNKIVKRKNIAFFVKAVQGDVKHLGRFCCFQCFNNYFLFWKQLWITIKARFFSKVDKRQLTVRNAVEA